MVGKKKIRFAVVGLGHIAQAAVLPAFRHAAGAAELTALVSGTPEKLRKLGRKYGVKNLYSYSEFDQCLESGEIDAVYIALPNTMHAEFTVRALRRGVHVLCEKPLALKQSDCRRMNDAAEESGTRLMTAYRLHFDQANLRALREAHARLGNLRYFTSNFSYQLRDKNNIRLRKKEGGSPLWDIGIYCINAARTFFRDEPLFVTALSARGPKERFRETKEMVVVTMKFPGERLASFTCSFGAGEESSYEVVGERGRLRMTGAYDYAGARELTVHVGEKQLTRKFRAVDQFAPELIYFAECIHRQRKPEPSGFEGWADVRVIRAIEQSMRTGRTVALPPAPRAIEGKPRPTLAQWIQRPRVREPAIVRATPPHQ